MLARILLFLSRKQWIICYEALYPERVGCLGKIHKPAAQAQGREKNRSHGGGWFFRPGAGEGGAADRPGIIFPGATDKAIVSIYFLSNTH